jgi:hypothetical protein
VGDTTSGEGLLDDKAELEYEIDVVEEKVKLLREEVRARGGGRTWVGGGVQGGWDQDVTGFWVGQERGRLLFD